MTCLRLTLFTCCLLSHSYVQLSWLVDKKISISCLKHIARNPHTIHLFLLYVSTFDLHCHQHCLRLISSTSNTLTKFNNKK